MTAFSVRIEAHRVVGAMQEAFDDEPVDAATVGELTIASFACRPGGSCDYRVEVKNGAGGNRTGLVLDFNLAELGAVELVARALNATGFGRGGRLPSQTGGRQ